MQDDVHHEAKPLFPIFRWSGIIIIITETEKSAPFYISVIDKLSDFLAARAGGVTGSTRSQRPA